MSSDSGLAPDHDPLLAKAVAALTARLRDPPSAAIVLGSGLGGLAASIDDGRSVPFSDVPGFARSTAAGHAGELILGRLADVSVIAMAGRLHRYEGWSMGQIVWPIRVFAALGTQRLIVSNAAGGLNPRFRVGDVMVIRDHINLLGPLRLPDSATSTVAGSRSLGCPMRVAEAYDQRMSAAARSAAIEERFDAWPGTYAATSGPNYETRAEVRMMRRMGADAVGMSTVPEVLAAIQCGMRVLGLSLITNLANPDSPHIADHSEVLQAGACSAAKMEAMVSRALVSE